MRARVLDAGPGHTIAPIFAKGDQVLSTLEGFASAPALTASRFSAIGA